MPRPRKCRRIGFIPNITEFVPKGNVCNDIVIMTVEELETIRLIDLENLDQEQSGERMGISRGTLQRILNKARNKIADSLVNGKKLVIEGGNYSIGECIYICTNCNHRYLASSVILENNVIKCPKCGSEEYICRGRKNFCLNRCNRYRGGISNNE